MISISAKLSPQNISNYFDGIFSLALLFALFASCIIVILLIIFPQYVYGTFGSSVVVVFAIVSLSLLQEALRRILFAKNEIKLVFVNDLISYLGQLSLLVLLFTFKESIKLIDVFLVIGASTLAAVIFSYFSLNNLHFSFKKLLYVWQRNWPMAKWMGLSAISNWFTGNLFIFMAGIYLGNTAVGALKAAQNILGINHILFKLIENMAPVKAGKLLVKSGINEMVSYFKQLTIVSIGCFCIFTLLIISFSDELMTIIYGAEYTDYSWLLISYSGIYLCLLLGFLLRICLRTLDNTKHIFFAYVTTGLLSLILSKFFVIQWALQGVISGMLIVNMIMLIMLMYFAKRTILQHKSNSTL